MIKRKDKNQYHSPPIERSNQSSQLALKKTKTLKETPEDKRSTPKNMIIASNPFRRNLSVEKKSDEN